MSTTTDLLVQMTHGLSTQVSALTSKVEKLTADNNKLNADNETLKNDLAEARTDLDKAKLTIGLASLFLDSPKYTDKFINTVVIPLVNVYPGQVKCSSTQVLITVGTHVSTGKQYGVRITPAKKGTNDPRVGLFYNWKCFHIADLGYGCDGKAIEGASTADINTPATKVLEEVASLVKRLPELITADSIMAHEIKSAAHMDSDTDDDIDDDIDDNDKKETSESNAGPMVGSLLSMLMGTNTR